MVNLSIIIITISCNQTKYLLVSPDLLQCDVQEHIEHAHKLGEYEAEHVEEEALAVGEHEEWWIEARLLAQLGTDFRFEYRNVHDQADQHEEAYNICAIKDNGQQLEED